MTTPCFLLLALIPIGVAACGPGASDTGATAEAGDPGSAEEAAARPAPEFTDPIVFQRMESNDITGHSPPETWIMDGDGSGLRHLGNHYRQPNVSHDQRALIHTDFGTAYSDPFGGDFRTEDTARIFREEITTGERTILREVEGCWLRDASLSPVTRGLTWFQECPDDPDDRANLMVELGSGRLLDASLTTAHSIHSAVGTRRGAVVEAWGERNEQDHRHRSEIGLIRFDGYGQGTYTALTDREHSHGNPAVSPDGRTVAWDTNQTGDSNDVFLIDLDGSNQRRLTTAGAQHPWFSRDGRWIVFSSSRSGSTEIWKMEIQTGETAQLTDDPAWDSIRPRW